MQLAILQESILDDPDRAQFSQNLADALRQCNHEVNIFQPRTGRWQDLEHLGPICRSFSLQRDWQEIMRHSLIYGSPLTVLPFTDAPTNPIIAFHSLAEALQRSLARPDYGEEAINLKKYMDEARAAGVDLECPQEEYYVLAKEAEEAACQTNYPIVTTTRGIKEDLIRYYDIKPNRITTIPYGAESSWFQPTPPCGECEQIFKETDPEKPMLIFHTRLKRGLTDFLAQGVDRILETFQRIRELQKLVILETNDPAYKSLFTKRGALVVDNPSPEHLSHLYSYGGMYVQTARYESRSLPILRAMASGLPTISFPVGMAEDIIETGKNGFLVQNSIQLIAKVDFLRSNPEKAKEFGRNASKLIKAKFTLEKSAEQYEKYLEELTT